MDRFQVEEVLKSCGVLIEEPLLVALSGGADSMALLHVMLNLGYSCQAAHCNFHLRGEESDGDEQFVLDYCAKHDVPLHVTHFDTNYEANRQGISIEMAARDLRYRWFGQLMRDYDIPWLATGHHGDDMIETFFLNLARGTGLRGLKGMEHRKGKVIRPLLDFRRQDIEAYCEKYHIAYRTDSSNADTSLQRNHVRHHILPAMDQLNSSFFDTMRQNFRNLHEVWQLFEHEVEEVRKQMVAEEDDLMLIPAKLIREHPQKRSVLFEILKPFHFNASVVAEIVESLDGIPGKQFFSSSHRLVRDRFNLVLVPREDFEEETFYIQSEDEQINHPLSLRFRFFSCDANFRVSRDPHKVHLDADLVEFPLKLRHWKEGDQFRPLGMEQFKKLSDFFVDEKFSRVEKDRTWLMLSGDDIIWIVGRRIDDRFKVTSSTRRILEIELTIVR